ncbi:MAG: adenosylcobinamide-GDP ribazoletransferase, partial [Clostridia bacterium]|nr:adenosylcobinamide-GDP ribazoletransferase [Clostridia bacterium]
MIHSFFSAFLMYTRIPMPQVEWREENRRYSLCFFPLCGAVIGGLLG